MVGARVSTAGEPAGRSIAGELRQVKRLGWRVDDVSLFGQEGLLDAFHRPRQLASQDNPELGEVGVEVAAVSRLALGVVPGVAIDEIPAHAVLTHGRLAPRA